MNIYENRYNSKKLKSIIVMLFKGRLQCYPGYFLNKKNIPDVSGKTVSFSEEPFKAKKENSDRQIVRVYIEFKAAARRYIGS